MKPLHSWNVSVEEAIRIQEDLKDRVILEKTFSTLKTIGGGDVAYSRSGDHLYGAIVVLSFPEGKILGQATYRSKVSFPYLPGLLSFREGPILIEAFQKLRVKPDLMIFEGQGVAHPREFGLASHMGLWMNLPSIGCTKTPLLVEFTPPGPLKGSYEWVRKEGKKVGAVLRTKDNVRPLFLSPGHRIDLKTSIRIVLECCRGFRIPEPLRKAHQLSYLIRDKGRVSEGRSLDQGEVAEEIKKNIFPIR